MTAKKSKKPLKSAKVKTKRRLKKHIVKTSPKRELTKRRIRVPAKKVLKAKKRRQLILLIIGILFFDLFGFWYMYKSAEIAEKFYDSSFDNASSLLAYNKDQIHVASVVGNRAKLISEITGFQSAPNDLAEFVLKDYKSFKKTCIVNGELTNEVSYTIKSVVYDSFALVSKYCGGSQNSILKKISGNWTVVFSSNLLVPCSMVNDFDIPRGISYHCQTDGVTFLNPNP